MPFTFSHPALILPFRSVNSKYISFTGLVVGSMVPDFEFFLKMRTGPNIGHHLPGIFLLNIPLAIIICILFHEFVKRPIFTYSPKFFKKRVNRYISVDWIKYAKKNYVTVIASIFIGICTHMIWDAFTHADGFFVSKFNVFSFRFSFKSIEIPVYSILQILFSILGLLVVLNSIIKMPTANIEINHSANSKRYWISVALLFLLIFSLRIYFLSQYNTFWDNFMGVMGSLIYAISIISICNYGNKD